MPNYGYTNGIFSAICFKEQKFTRVNSVLFSIVTEFSLYLFCQKILICHWSVRNSLYYLFLAYKVLAQMYHARKMVLRLSYVSSCY